MIYLHKILPIFFLPFGISLILALGGLLVGRRRLIWAGVGILWLSSTPVISARLFRASERSAERIPAVDAPIVDAIVVLSGGRIVAPGRAAISEWGEPDRFFAGVDLFRAGKAPLLVFTGGWLVWEPHAQLEGDILTEYAKGLGVPATGIITTGPVSTTAEEAQAVATILRERLTMPPRVLLVTSAFHMPRAQQLFEHAGLAVIPFPVDFRLSAGGRLTVLDFLPGPGALVQTETALRELYGRLYYRFVEG